MAQKGLEFAVLGPGGVGGFLAGLLARSGNAVVVLANPDTARTIEETGLHLESKRFGSFEVELRTAERLSRPVDACLITVKATHLNEAVSRVPPDVLGQGLVIPFLNGIDHVDRLRAIYRPSSVVAATIRIETIRVKTGLIRRTSPFAAIDIAANADNRERVDAVAARFRQAGLDVRVREDELAMLWDKFALLAPMALLTTHERANVGIIRTKRRTEAIALIAELSAVAGGDGVAIDSDAVVKLLDSVPESMESSMQRDQAAGRPLELDALGGALLRRARRAAINVPVTTRLVEDLADRTGSPVAVGDEA